MTGRGVPITFGFEIARDYTQERDKGLWNTERVFLKGSYANSFALSSHREAAV